MIAPGLLLLADSRLPSGGHGHSGGVEAAVERGLVRTPEDLAAFLAGRLATGGQVVAAAAAAACALAGRPVEWGRWDQAISARTPSTALRTASRAQGSALLRTVEHAFPGPAVAALRQLGRPHQPLVLGVAAHGAGADPADAAVLALHHLVGGACSAAVRLLGLDPLLVAQVAARTATTAGPLAAEAAAAGVAAAAADDPTRLPADGNPLFDVLAQLHDSTEVTLFAS